MSAENVRAAAALTAEIFPDPWPESAYERELRNPCCIAFVSMCEERAVGFIHCDYVLDELALNVLAVDEAFRRRGLARRLWEQVRRAAEGICRTCDLEVRSGNIPARKLYESLGFVQNGLRPRYYTHPDEAAVLMRYTFPDGQS